MNSIDIRTEKANAIFRYRSIQKLTTLFRFMEVLVFIVLISTFSAQFPFSVPISADSFRGISFPCFSPKLVFVIGNVIILILLFKSRFADRNGDQIERIDVYDEYVKRCEKNVANCASDVVTIKSEKMKMKMKMKTVELECEDGQSQSKQSATERKMLNSPPEICRSQSEKMMTVEFEDGQSQRKLRRSVTEGKMLKNGDCFSGETPAAERCGVDELSNEAFRRTVEAFIERQQRSLRDEELAPAPYVGA